MSGGRGLRSSIHLRVQVVISLHNEMASCVIAGSDISMVWSGVMQNWMPTEKSMPGPSYCLIQSLIETTLSVIIILLQLNETNNEIGDWA